jgi:hypothetical protein
MTFDQSSSEGAVHFEALAIGEDGSAGLRLMAIRMTRRIMSGFRLIRFAIIPFHER